MAKLLVLSCQLICAPPTPALAQLSAASGRRASCELHRPPAEESLAIALYCRVSIVERSPLLAGQCWA
jgi:hypothetical protein